MSDVGTVGHEKGIRPHKTCHGSHHECHASGYLCNATHDDLDADCARDTLFPDQECGTELGLGIVAEYAHRHGVDDLAIMLVASPTNPSGPCDTASAAYPTGDDEGHG